MFRCDPFPAGHFLTNPNELSHKSSTMDSLLATYNDDDNSSSNTTTTKSAENVITGPPLPAAVTTITTTVESEIELVIDLKDDPMASEDLSDLDPKDSPNFAKLSSTSEDDGLLDDNDNPPAKKQKQLSALPLSPPELVKPEPESPATVEGTIPKGKPPASASASSKKKGKGKNNNVWTKSASRKGKKKTKGNTPNASAQKVEDTVLISPIPRFLDKNDDNVDAKICLSKVYKAEKVELSEDRMSAGSCKGYRMVRATRGVTEGAWYFEIKVVKLGETGHTRLGWSTEKGDLQAPVGYDGNSFGYRDIDGSKLHKALREKYGEEGYVEGDVIGFYINLPDGSLYEPKPPQLVFFKGQKYMCAPDAKEDPPKVVPGSEISFFRNGICQGVAFKDLFGGRYYPAASMYTLPDQPNCVVKFNFGPEFEAFPEDFGGRPLPKPMVEVPYRSFESKVENGDLWGPPRMCPRVKLVKEHDTKTMDAGE